MNDAYIIIDPKYRDPDIFCEVIIGNRACRSTIQIYIDEVELVAIADALRKPGLEHLPVEFIPDDEMWRDLQFAALPSNEGKILQVTVINEDEFHFTTCLGFPLSPAEAVEMGDNLKAWLANPVCQFVWKG